MTAKQLRERISWFHRAFLWGVAILFVLLLLTPLPMTIGLRFLLALVVLVFFVILLVVLFCWVYNKKEYATYQVLYHVSIKTPGHIVLAMQAYAEIDAWSDYGFLVASILFLADEIGPYDAVTVDALKKFIPEGCDELTVHGWLVPYGVNLWHWSEKLWLTVLQMLPMPDDWEPTVMFKHLFNPVPEPDFMEKAFDSDDSGLDSTSN